MAKVRGFAFSVPYFKLIQIMIKIQIQKMQILTQKNSNIKTNEIEISDIKRCDGKDNAKPQRLRRQCRVYTFS